MADICARDPPDFKNAEVAIVVGDPWQGLGLGSKMMECIIEIARDKGLENVYGLILRDNAARAHTSPIRQIYGVNGNFLYRNRSLFHILFLHDSMISSFW